MVKRIPEHDLGGEDQSYVKRQKTSHVISSAEDVQSSGQLQQLLAFDQDAGRAKHGIQSFKAFLEAFSEDQVTTRLDILQEYLEAQIPLDKDDKTTIYMEDIMKTWSFASQSNNDSLLSAVPAVLALLLRISSSKAELKQPGLRLGRTLLQKRQLELIARGLTANNAKEFVISPVLRLLQQIVSFDGGALAKHVFKAKDYTFKSLARNLGIRYTGEGFEDRKRPSVRTNALRFFVACVKFLPSEEKKELLSTHQGVTAAVARDVNGDPHFVLVDLLENLKKHVLQDKDLAREARSRFLNPINLERFVTLYGYDRPDDELSDSEIQVDVLTHEFMILACTTPDLGVLQRQAGFYPRGMDPDLCNGSERLQDSIDIGLENLEPTARFIDNVPVRNNTLSEFIQVLRPWSNTKQSELLMAIFKAAPELVADYYFNKKSFSFEPKLTATWVGYSAVIFSTAQLAIPPYFGHPEGRYGLVPPPTSVIIESILPKPVTQKALSKCLFNQKSPLVTFFATRLLVIAFQKLRDILIQYRQVAAPLWDDAAKQLVEEFCKRCPSMLDVINSFKSISNTEMMQRQAASKLLVMFYETVPQVALEAKFDVSNALSDALRLLLEDDSRVVEGEVMRIMIVENLFQVAFCSPGMRWFHKGDAFSHSPFTALLRLTVEASAQVPLRTIRSILDSIIEESGIMQSQTIPSGLHSIIAALGAQEDLRDLEVYRFLDNCALRCATTPIKYIDLADQYHRSAYTTVQEHIRRPLSLLIVAVAEQWQYVVKSSEPNTLQKLADFVSSFFAASIKLGEDKKTIKSLIKHLAAETTDGSRARRTIERSKKLVDTILLDEFSSPVLENGQKAKASHNLSLDTPAMAPAIFNFPLEDLEDHRALNRWRNRDVVEVIEDGHAASLISLLSNPHLSARKEALVNISKLTADLKQSDHESKDQIWLLLMELFNTAAKSSIQTAALPSPLTAFTAHALSVLQNPLHQLYPKVNKFLCAGSTWDVDKIPLVKDILDEPPFKDGDREAETSWLLTYLASALRTPADMHIFHKRRIFEKLLNIYNHSYASDPSKELILMIVARATTVEGGSDTLITRFSILTWLEAQIRSEIESGLPKGTTSVVLRGLLQRLLDTCDRSKIEAWSGCKLEDRFASI